MKIETLRQRLREAGAAHEERDGWQRPSWERTADIARTLHRRGFLTKLRQSTGQDVEAGCGLLRVRAAQAARQQAGRTGVTVALHRKVSSRASSSSG